MGDGVEEVVTLLESECEWLHESLRVAVTVALGEFELLCDNEVVSESSSLEEVERVPLPDMDVEFVADNLTVSVGKRVADGVAV